MARQEKTTLTGNELVQAIHDPAEAPKAMSTQAIADLASGALGSLDKLGFNTAAGATVTQGELAWNADEETLDLGQNGAVLQIGQEVHYHVRNNSGVTVNNGEAVMSTGTIGASGRITVAKMNNDGTIQPYYFMGIATEDITDTTDGKITHFGKVRGIQTNGVNYSETWVDGDLIYLSKTVLGGLTKVEPTAPAHKVPIAIVIEAHASNGTLFVRATGNVGLHEAHDVQVTAVADQDFLRYNTANQRWENVQHPSIYTGNGTLPEVRTISAEDKTLILEGDVPANFVTDVFRIDRKNRGGTPGVGLGTSINFRLDDTANVLNSALSLGVEWTDATLGAEVSKASISTMKAGGLSESFNIQGSQVGFTDYGSGTITGTPAYHLAVDASGNVIEETLVAADITDFDTEVSNNTDVAANTAKVTNANHTGDVTGDTALTIANDAVTYAKMQNVVADNVLLGNNSGAGGVVDELTATEVRTLLNVADGANNYTHPNHTGDVTSTGDGATVIADDAVTYAKMQNAVSGDVLLGNNAGAGGQIAELSAGTVISILGINSHVDPTLQIEVFAGNAAVTTGDGVNALVIPSVLNNFTIIDVMASVEDKGVTGTTDVQLRRWRSGAAVDVLSTAITIGDEWFANDGLINGTNDTVLTGDRLYVDVDAVHSGTAPNGLIVTIRFQNI